MAIMAVISVAYPLCLIQRPWQFVLAFCTTCCKSSGPALISRRAADVVDCRLELDHAFHHIIESGRSAGYHPIIAA